MEMDARRLATDLGYSSLYEYCKKALLFSEDETYRRIEAAHVAQRFPCVLDYVASGKVTLISLLLLRPHLEPKNCEELLELARGLLRHAKPGGELEGVIAQALELLVDHLRKKKFGETKKPRSEKRSHATEPALVQNGAEPATHTHDSACAPKRRVPNATRRTVATRDGIRCAFIGTDGHRCEEREAERRYGKGYMKAARNAARSRSRSKGSTKTECQGRLVRSTSPRVRDNPSPTESR